MSNNTMSMETSIELALAHYHFRDMEGEAIRSEMAREARLARGRKGWFSRRKTGIKIAGENASGRDVVDAGTKPHFHSV
ncbi:MAG TPA: hypothetical protein VH186_06900 [Chloroflexia bacterium]|nr:hypothetical protein [Chloroflexia bacterium]